MSDALQAKTGRYFHAVDAKGIKSFGSRSFAVVIASAYDAGVVGSENNGIAILDEDNRTVVLDRHAPIGSGYHGPSQGQRAEFARIMAMDWKAFTDFVRSHPNYRGSLVDIDMSQPDPVIEIEDREIYPEGNRLEGNPYQEHLTRRRVIIEYLRDHALYHLDGSYSKLAFSWDVKVYSFDTSGRIADGPFEPDVRLDEQWAQHLESNGELFWEAAERGVHQYEDGIYTLYGSDEEGKYEFARTGRSSGHLVMTGFKGLKGDAFSWSDSKEVEEFLQNMDDGDLVELYRVVNQVDEDLTKPKIHQEMAFQFAVLREGKEDEWATETPTI